MSITRRRFLQGSATAAAVLSTSTMSASELFSPVKKIPSASHFGAFYAYVQDGKIKDIKPQGKDSRPGMMKALVDRNYSNSRIKYPYVRKSFLKECDIIMSHMSDTISDFQNFFKPSKEKTRFSLQEECKKASYIIESSLKYNNIEFQIDTEDDCEVLGYPREFSQAILNILSNAKDVLKQRNIEKPYIKLTLKEGKRYAIVKIEDNAGGIITRIIDRIFEPYFTTKPRSKGTGIGLYISKIIIEDNMHGFLDVKNSKNGAIFTIKLIK